jgi:hypothetical protein
MKKRRQGKESREGGNTTVKGSVAKKRREGSKLSVRKSIG